MDLTVLWVFNTHIYIFNLGENFSSELTVLFPSGKDHLKQNKTNKKKTKTKSNTSHERPPLIRKSTSKPDIFIFPFFSFLKSNITFYCYDVVKLTPKVTENSESDVM